MELSEYRALVAKVDAFFGKVRDRYASDLACRSGCSECCHVRLSVAEVEAERIREHLRALDAPARERIAALAASRAGDDRCAALDDEGRCAIYEARPLICRTQGLPMRVRTGGRGGGGWGAERSSLRVAGPDRSPPGDGEPALPVLDVCPLNFEGKTLAALDADCILDVQTIDTLLGVVNARACASADTQKRTKIEDVLSFAHRV